MSEKEALLHARLNAYQWLVTKTDSFIQLALAQVKRPYVSCSFGKDSAVMLDMVLRHRPQVPVVFLRYPETEYIDNYAEVIAAWNLPNLHQPLADVRILEECNEKDIIPTWAIEHGHDGGFVGLRAEESRGRRMSLNMYGKLHWAKSGQCRVCPLADWKTADIAAYTYANKLPLLDSYKLNGIAERSVNSISNDEWGFREAQLQRIKRQDITKFNQLVATFPELRAYV